MGALLSACLDRPLTETEKKELDAVEQVAGDILVQEAKKLSVMNKPRQ